jgi:hypothetical protein
VKVHVDPPGAAEQTVPVVDRGLQIHPRLDGKRPLQGDGRRRAGVGARQPEDVRRPGGEILPEPLQRLIAAQHRPHVGDGRQRNLAGLDRSARQRRDDGGCALAVPGEPRGHGLPLLERQHVPGIDDRPAGGRIAGFAPGGEQLGAQRGIRGRRGEQRPAHLGGHPAHLPQAAERRPLELPIRAGITEQL